MALQKAIPDPYGTTELANAYWRVVQFNFCVQEGAESGMIVLNVYKDAAARAAGKAPIQGFSVPVGKADDARTMSFAGVMSRNSKLFENIKAAIYRELKEWAATNNVVELAGATDA